MKKLIPFFLLLVLTPLPAQSEELLDILQQIESDPAKVSTAIKAGDSRALLCKFCHGADGNSKKPSIPNLASQNTVYLINQFELFASGERQNKTMNDMAKVLTAKDKVNIALFYNAQKVKPQTTFEPGLVSRGKHLFETKCFFCHGRDGYGKENLPRVAGQPSEYIIRTLSSYNSALVKRAETQMSAIARTLTNNEITALAAYLTSLP